MASRRTGSTGFGMWYWNPARSAFRWSSAPAYADSAAAGTWPPRPIGSMRTRRMRERPSSPRHGDVAQEDVGRHPFDELERLLRGGRGRDDHAVLLKDQPQGFAGVLLVVDQHDRQAGRRKAGLLRARFAGARRLPAFMGRKGKHHRERAPPPRAGGFRPHQAAMMPDHVANHIETQAQAVVGAGARAVLLPEPLEREGQEPRAHALAAVGDAEPGLLVDGVQTDLDAASGRGELDGVREKVGHGLLQPARIPHHPDRGLPRRPGEDHAFEGGIRRGGVHCHPDHVPQIEQLRDQLEAAGGDARGMEQVFDDAFQGARAALDDPEGALPFRGRQLPFLKQAEPYEDGAQGRSQLVGEQGQELVLQVARLLHPMTRGLLPLQEGVMSRVTQRLWTSRPSLERLLASMRTLFTVPSLARRRA